MSTSISPNARALLDTIRKAEGTWAGGSQKGYGIMFGGGTFDPAKGHPDRVVRSGGYASAAAGAYQFMPATWRGVAKQLGRDPGDFSPAAQDAAALQLVRNRGVDPNKPLTAEALNKLAPEWASLPTTSGKSYYGQPVKERGGLLNFYQSRLGAQPLGAQPLGGQPPGGQPVAAPNPGNQVAAAPPAPAGGGGGAAPSAFDEGSTSHWQGLMNLTQENGQLLDGLAAARPRPLAPAAGLSSQRFAGEGEVPDAIAEMRAILRRAGVNTI